MLLIQMSQDAVVPAAFTEGGRGERVHRWLSLLGRVGRAVGGSLQERRRKGVS